MTDEVKPLRKTLSGKKTNVKERIRNTDPYLASARVLQNEVILLRQEVRALISLLRKTAQAVSLPTSGLDTLAEEIGSEEQ